MLANGSLGVLVQNTWGAKTLTLAEQPTFSLDAVDWMLLTIP
ncbi:hypothetical protein [Polyangium jinanense]|nr:hypothetical protein [Polyangium jinanense]